MESKGWKINAAYRQIVDPHFEMIGKFKLND